MDRLETWGWNLNEMKEASFHTTQGAGARADADQQWQPSISGFTPINQRAQKYSLSTPSNAFDGAQPDPAENSLIATKGRKRKQHHLRSGSARAEGPRKTPRQRRAIKTGKSDKTQTSGISQILKVTKPRIGISPSCHGRDGHAETKPCDHVHFLDGLCDNPNSHSTANDHGKSSARLGLREHYQAAFTRSADRKSFSKEQHGISETSDVVIDSFEQTMEDSQFDDEALLEAFIDQPALETGGDGSGEPCDDIFHGLDTELDANFIDVGGQPTEEPCTGDAFVAEPLKATGPEAIDLSQRCVNLSKPAETHNRDRMSHSFSEAPALPALDTSGSRNRDNAHHPLLNGVPNSHSNYHASKDDETFVGVDEFLSDDTFDEVLNLTQRKPATETQTNAPPTSDDMFGDDDLDAEFMNIGTTTPEKSKGQSPPFTQRTPTLPKLQWMPPTPYTPKERSNALSPSVRPSSTITPPAPVTKPIPLAERSPNIPPHTVPSKDGRLVPFVRPAFPRPLLPRSPIMGISPTTVLRTCFRIGEAFNAASMALRNSTNAIIELYCRVKYSDRDVNGYKHFFELGDLFTPGKSPSLTAQYSLWKGVGLWEHDSRQFLGEGGKGKKARVIGRIKRGDKNRGWDMTILNVWEVDWEDVGIAKGVICA